MEYTVFSVLTCAVFAALNILWRKFPAARKVIFTVNSAIASVGILLFAAAIVLSRSVVESADSSAEWAGGMLDAFFEMNLPVFAVLFILIITPAFLAWWDSHSRTGARRFIRSAASVFASALILLLGGFYSVTVQNTYLPLSTVVYLTSFGEAMLFRALYSVEYRSYIINERTNVRAK